MIKQKIVVESEGKCGSGYAQYKCLGGGLYWALSCVLSRVSDSEWLCVAHDMTRDLTTCLMPASCFVTHDPSLYQTLSLALSVTVYIGRCSYLVFP